MPPLISKSIKVMLLLTLLLLSACNLTSAPEQQISLTQVSTNTPPPSRTPLGTQSVPTTLPITPLATVSGGQLPPTSVVFVPTSAVGGFPTITPLPISIVILSPIPGNVVAGNVQVLGAAIHPQFLQYQLEYGPDPNPGNLWYQATGVVQTPVLNGLLGIWNTTIVPDGVYQLRLRVTLRDGTSLATVVNAIRVQNQVPTPIPSATPSIPRPIAAFNVDRATGQPPLVVQFTNQSSGTISSYNWSFGDGGSSTVANPNYTFRLPGVYNVTLTVNGPGGSSNVSRQINVQSLSAPVAAFTQDKLSGPSPLNVAFTNQSTGQIRSYSWTFGDGGTSTEQNPRHQFTAVGTYNVILSVTGPGGTSFVTRKITVEDPVVPAPDAVFTQDKTSGNIPLAVQFTNQSTGQITSYTWDFGDGQTSVETNPNHTYTQAGTYTVVLTAVGPGGQDTAQTTITTTQAPNAPVAVFTASPTSGDAPLNVKFTNQSTGSITSYAWDFGDGGTSTDQNPTHTYASVGTYTAKLTVTGPGGTNQAQTTITATQPIALPVAAFAANPTSGTAPLNVQFTNQSTGESLTYKWDFGDSTPGSTDANPTHSYANTGTYTVKLTVSNSAGGATASATITVSNAPVAPVAAFTANPTTGTVPLQVVFDSTTSTGNIDSYAWSFGDGGTSTDANPSYTYNAAGTYTVTLTLTGAGTTSASTGTVTVNAAAVAPIAAFTANPTNGTTPLLVAFDSTTSTGSIDSYAWDFGDGGTSTDANPSHTYTAAGTYTVTLTLTGAGTTSASTGTVTVNAAAVAPIAAFTANPTSGDAPLPVTFDSTTSTGSIDSYAWDFGDGGTSTDANPSYTYNAAGTYTVTLTLTGAGTTSSATGTITVNAAAVAPIAAFTANPTSGTAPLQVVFDSTTSTGSIDSYAWDFGDGGTSTDANPSYTYNAAGTYTVTLALSGAGTTSTATGTVTVTAAAVAPIAAFTANPTSGTAPLQVVFDSTTSTGSIDSYAWSFGDGGMSTDANPSYTYNAAGTYTVILTLTGAGTTSTATGTITVNAAAVAPVAAFTANPTSGDAPLPVTFDSTTSTGSIDSYAWDFGDGGTSTDANPSYTYNATGTYTVTLTLSGAGTTSATTGTITVNAAPVAPPINVPFAFVTNRDGNNEIYLMETDGSLQNLTNNGGNDSAPAWSPDGNKIAFVSDRDGNNEIYVMDADGNNVIRVSNNDASDSAPVWSPDGSKIVFVTNRDGNNEIYVMDADGNNQTNLSNNPANDNSPAPSPNGALLAFVTDRDGNNEIYTQSTDGTLTNITNDAGSDFNPAWTRDNNRVLFVTNRDGNNEIYIMGADGSNPTRLTDNPANDLTPKWSPDDSQIVFATDRDGNNEIYVMGTDGSNPVNVTNDGADDNSPVSRP